MRSSLLKIVMCGALLLAGCSKGPEGPTATVSLRDGTTFSGTVTKSDTTGVTLVSASGETRTYPMSQVDSIAYADAAAAPGAADTAAVPVPPPATTTTAEKTAPPPPPPPAPAPAPAKKEASPVAAVIPTRTVTAGTKISVRNSDVIRAGVAETGQTFPGVVVSDVLGADGGLAIPKGADALLVVRESVGQGKVQGRSEIVVDLDSVTVRGRRYRVATQEIAEVGTQGVGKNKRSAKFIGGGAALGAIIGAVAGGGKGAAIGAAAGAGGGVAAQSLTRGKAVSIPSESVLGFELEAPLEIRLSN